jgi:hypothetical protein
MQGSPFAGTAHAFPSRADAGGLLAEEYWVSAVFEVMEKGDLDTRYEMKEWHVLQKERREFPRTVHGARGLYQSLAAVVLSVLLLGGGSVPARDRSAPSGTLRHELIPLTQITPERGRDFLAQLRIGTVSRLPGTNTLVVTGDEIELQKAVAVLDLVDTRTEFQVRQLGPMSPSLPSNAEIARAVGGVSIGTFANPPRDRTRMRAIVDVHQGHVVVIAPAIQLQDIRVAVELGPEVLRGRKNPSQPAQATAAPIIPASAMLESSLHPQGGAQIPRSTAGSRIVSR